MIKLFSLDGIQKKPAVFDPPEWTNGAVWTDSLLEISWMDSGDSLRMGVKGDGQRLSALIAAVKTRSRTLLDIAKQVAVRLDATKVVRDPKGTQLVSKMGDAVSTNLSSALSAL